MQRRSKVGSLHSLDPGIRGCGVAEFVNSVLVRCAYVVNTVGHGQRVTQQMEMAGEVAAYIGECHTLVAEWPRVYARDIQKSNANDLLPLCGVVASTATIVRPWSIIEYRPSEWKGGVPKKAFNDRILSRLSPAELAIVPNDHNVIDAVGIGLKALGRLDRKMVIARE